MRNLLFCMMAVAVGFGVVLGIGFWWQPGAEWGVVGGVAVGVIGLGLGLRWLGYSSKEHAHNGLASARQEGRVPRPFEPCLRGLCALPVRRGRAVAPVATVMPGRPAEICEHLAVVEGAMRGAGLEVRRLPESEWGPVIAVRCRIDRLAELPEFVVYEERYQPERYEFENPRADLLCTKCGRRGGGVGSG
ncbi:MAG: hypothetical protein NTV52_21795 [Acidobacteria bacterium]|nr:hypothetical protein [Acidobacteriota bacterium]